MTASQPGPRFCAACGSAVSPGARFCHQCGGALAGAPWRPGPPVIAAAAVVLLAAVVIVVLLNSGSAPAAGPPPVASSLPGRAPDISGMTPRQQFDRLYDRVTGYAAQGDTAMVFRFTDHALSAYAQLPEVDAEARYRAGLLYAGVGQFAPALALADSILAAEPGQPLGQVLRQRVAELHR